MVSALGGPLYLTWGKCLQLAKAPTTTTPGKPSVPSPRPGWNLGCLTWVFDLPGLGKGEGWEGSFLPPVP